MGKPSNRRSCPNPSKTKYRLVRRLLQECPFQPKSTSVSKKPPSLSRHRTPKVRRRIAPAKKTDQSRLQIFRTISQLKPKGVSYGDQENVH